jgi:hypothetical protein
VPALTGPVDYWKGSVRIRVGGSLVWFIVVKIYSKLSVSKVHRGTITGCRHGLDGCPPKACGKGLVPSWWQYVGGGAHGWYLGHWW